MNGAHPAREDVDSSSAVDSEETETLADRVAAKELSQSALLREARSRDSSSKEAKRQQNGRAQTSMTAAAS